MVQPIARVLKSDPPDVGSLCLHSPTQSNVSMLKLPLIKPEPPAATRVLRFLGFSSTEKHICGLCFPGWRREGDTAAAALHASDPQALLRQFIPVAQVRTALLCAGSCGVWDAAPALLLLCCLPLQVCSKQSPKWKTAKNLNRFAFASW